MVVEVAGIKLRGDAKLLEGIEALNLLRLGLGLGQRGQEHGRQNRDDGNHHQQFDEREARPAAQQ